MPIDFLQRPRYNGTNLALVSDATATGLVYTVEVDLGTVPIRSGHFDITTAGLTVGQNVIIQQVNGPYTGKGTLADEAEMDQLSVTGQAISSTVIRCYWASPTAVRGNFKFAYTLVSTVSAVPSATEGTQGIARLSSQSQANTGTDDATILTPLKERNKRILGLFSVGLSANQTVTANVAARVNFNTEALDADSWFDSATNFRYTPQVAGWYEFIFMISYLASTTGLYGQAYLLKNGAAVVARAPTQLSTGASQSLYCAAPGGVSMNGTTDYVELWGITNIGPYLVDSYFMGHYVGKTS